MRPEGAAVFHFRGGKVTRFVGYFDRERAFADLGLSPGAAPHTRKASAVAWAEKQQLLRR